MTNLVDRLREFSGDSTAHMLHRAAMEEAANEIERLCGEMMETRKRHAVEWELKNNHLDELERQLRSAVEPNGDSARLEWVMRNVSGAEWRRLGALYGDAAGIRDAIDIARSSPQSDPNGRCKCLYCHEGFVTWGDCSVHERSCSKRPALNRRGES